jgi:hypothetical protein
MLLKGIGARPRRRRSASSSAAERAGEEACTRRRRGRVAETGDGDPPVAVHVASRRGAGDGQDAGGETQAQYRSITVTPTVP